MKIKSTTLSLPYGELLAIDMSLQREPPDVLPLTITEQTLVFKILQKHITGSLK